MWKGGKKPEFARLWSSTGNVEKEWGFPTPFVEECFSTSCIEKIHRNVWKKEIRGVIARGRVSPREYVRRDEAFKPPFSFETSKENRRLIGEKKNVGGLSEHRAPQSLKRELYSHRHGRRSAAWNAAPRCLYRR